MASRLWSRISGSFSRSLGELGLSTANTVNVVKLEGIIRGAHGGIAQRSLNLAQQKKWIDKAYASIHDNTKAIAFVVDSPGGEPAQAELLAKYMMQKAQSVKIPTYAFAEGTAASGGYFLLVAADECYALETSLVGSIGVITSSFGAVDAIQRLGLERRVYTAGTKKSLMDAFRPVTGEQEQVLRQLLDGVHKSFRSFVQQRRGDRIKVGEDDLFSGRAWTGSQAVELGLVDGVADVHSFMADKFGTDVKLWHVNKDQSGLAGLLGIQHPSGTVATRGDVRALAAQVADGVLDALHDQELSGRHRFG